jgi:hypothetical protein
MLAMRMFAKADLADIILSAETAALEDGLINALQHRSIRSIFSAHSNEPFERVLLRG